MSQPIVLVTAAQLVPEAQQMLRNAGLAIEFMAEPIDEAALTARLSKGDVQAVVLRGSKPFTAPVLQAARGLKLIAKNGAGIDSVDLAEAARLGIGVAVAAAANAEAVAEHALAMMLALVRALPQLDRTLRNGGWEGTAWQGRDFRGSVVGIVGFGAIGQATARLAAALGARVLVLDRHGRGAAGHETVATLDALLPRVDILSLHCPLNDATRGLIGERELALMPRGSFLVNTARGAVVDEAALVNALRSQHLAAAGLDTFAVEPLPADHPLRTLPNALITPHVAGVTRAAALRVATLTAQNVIDVLTGRALPAAHVVVAPA